nr:hypothetical protein [Tanacetum cinerariifolium]
PRWENDPGKLGTAPDLIKRLVSDQSSNPTSSTNPNPKGRNRRHSKQRIAPTEGYEDAIFVSAITVDNFKLKHGLLTLVQNKQFYGHDKEDPHTHIRYFNKITSSLKFPNVLNTSFLHPKQQVCIMKSPLSNNDLMNLSVKHGIDSKIFFEPIPIMVFQNYISYNALNSKDQDSLNFAAGGNFLDKMPRDCLSIIESKSKVLYSRDKPVVSEVSTNASTSGVSPDVAKLKDMVKALLLDKIATDGNVYRDNILEFVSQASVVNYNQGNTSYRPQMMSNQIRPTGFPPIPNNQNVQQNNQNCFIPNQNRGNNFNQGSVYQPSIFQQPAYQAPAYQALAPQTQGVSKEDFSAYIKANDVVMKNMQTQGQNMQNQLTNLTDLITKFVNSNTTSTSSLGTLPSNIIAKPKSDLKAITTQSVNPTNNENIKDVQPQAVQYESPVSTELAIASVSASKPNPKASIPYPLRRNDERNHEKANNQIEKFYQIFKDMSFKIRFADALILMHKFASTLKALIGNEEKLSLPDLTPTCMTLELADHSISRPVGVAEDVYVKVGSFHFSDDFVVVDFDADPRVPLILGRSLLKTERALIDVFEEYSQEVLGFLDTISSGNPTPYHDSIVSATSLTLTPFENSDFLLKEVDAFLVVEDEPTSSKFHQSYLGPEGDILLLEAFLNDDPSSPPHN